MKSPAETLLTTALVATALLLSTAAQATTFQQFDHMAAQDRQDYLNFLVEGAHQVLIDQGRTADAAKIYQLFNEIHVGNSMSVGRKELEDNLADERVSDADQAIKDPSKPRSQFEVESALAETLRMNHIELTPEFYKAFVQLAKSFRPKFPPK